MAATVPDVEDEFDNSQASHACMYPCAACTCEWPSPMAASECHDPVPVAV